MKQEKCCRCKRGIGSGFFLTLPVCTKCFNQLKKQNKFERRNITKNE